MFRRLNPEMWEWQSIASIGAFALTLAVFLFFIVRALRLKSCHRALALGQLSAQAAQDLGHGRRRSRCGSRHSRTTFAKPFFGGKK
jgi:hypothetical protein